MAETVTTLAGLAFLRGYRFALFSSFATGDPRTADPFFVVVLNREKGRLVPFTDKSLGGVLDKAVDWLRHDREVPQ